MKRQVIVVIALSAGCGDKGNPVEIDAPPVVEDADTTDAPPDANPLATLDGTGLCLNAACTEINPDAKEYRPRFELWADGATKRRWIELPPGTQIDTTNMDRWVFPVGTKLWKEFTRDGTRVETRFITKNLADDDAPAAWFFVTYEWNASQDATTVRAVGVEDANGTLHDIPSRAQCKECHDSLRPSRVLGFQALQLDFDSAAGLLDLEDLIAGGLLTAPPTGGTAGTRFPLPGNDIEKAALGYMHGNCGHCHNPSSPTFDIAPVDVLIDTTKLASFVGTPTFVTTVDVDAAVSFFENGTEYSKIIISGDPANSGLIVRMNSSQGIRRMPKIASEVVDPDGQTALVAWINAL
jgi:hypothetical protein